MSKMSILNSVQEVLLEMDDSELLRAEFLKQKIDGQFIDQFNLEILYTQDEVLNNLIGQTELTIRLEAENGTRILTNAEISQYTNKLSRDGKFLIERAIFDGELG